VLIVGTDPIAVEADLLAGRLSCPRCASVLRRWGHARCREVRTRTSSEQRRPRRAICRLCNVTHVLLGEDTLVRRRDDVEVIGAALVKKGAGMGRRSIAASLCRHESTVASWLRRFSETAERLREHFTAWAAVLDPGHGAISPTGSAFGDALEVIGVLASVAVRRFGPRSAFCLASVLSQGGLLATRAHHYRPPS